MRILTDELGCVNTLFDRASRLGRAICESYASRPKRNSITLSDPKPIKSVTRHHAPGLPRVSDYNVVGLGNRDFGIVFGIGFGIEEPKRDDHEMGSFHDTFNTNEIELFI